MKSQSEFSRYYENNIVTHIAGLDQLRIKAGQRKILVFAGMVLLSIGVGLFAYYVKLYTPVKWTIVIFYLGSIGVIYRYEVKGAIRRYENQFNLDLLDGMVHFVAPGFSYDADKYIPEAGFCLSDIYGQTCRIYNAGNYVEGFIGNTHMKFCQVNANMSHADFEGLFLMVSLNTDTIHPIYIITNEAYSDNQHTNHKLHANRPPLLKTLNAAFDEKYSVYSSDANEALSILKPDLQNRILAYAQKTRKEINLSIHRTTLFVTINSNHSLFEPGYSSEPDKQTIEEWFKYLDDAYDIVDDLNLKVSV
jgi:hypothetical protein